MEIKEMKDLLIITPVKNSIDLTEQTIRSVMDSIDRQHCRDVVAHLVLEIEVGQAEMGAGIVRFPGGQSWLLLCAPWSGSHVVFRCH